MLAKVRLWVLIRVAGSDELTIPTISAVTAWDKDFTVPPRVGSGKLINITEYAARYPSYFPQVKSFIDG